MHGTDNIKITGFHALNNTYTRPKKYLQVLATDLKSLAAFFFFFFFFASEMFPPNLSNRTKIFRDLISFLRPRYFLLTLATELQSTGTFSFP